MFYAGLIFLTYSSFTIGINNFIAQVLGLILVVVITFVLYKEYLALVVFNTNSDRLYDVLSRILQNNNLAHEKDLAGFKLPQEDAGIGIASLPGWKVVILWPRSRKSFDVFRRVSSFLKRELKGVNVEPHHSGRLIVIFMSLAALLLALFLLLPLLRLFIE